MALIKPSWEHATVRKKFQVKVFLISFHQKCNSFTAISPQGPDTVAKSETTGVKKTKEGEKE